MRRRGSESRCVIMVSIDLRSLIAKERLQRQKDIAQQKQASQTRFDGRAESIRNNFQCNVEASDNAASDLVHLHEGPMQRQSIFLRDFSVGVRDVQVK